MSVNKIIIDIMDRESITQKQLSDKLHISRQAVSQMVKGKDMRVSTLLTILNVLGYTIQVIKVGEYDE